MRSWAKFIFAAAIAGALWVSELGSWTTGAASTEAVAEIAALELSPMEVHEVRVETLRSMVPFVGTLRPVNRATLRAEVAARVSEVLVEEGQRVAKGDVVARLDTEDLATKVKEREANLESAKAQRTLAEFNRDRTMTLREKGFASQAAVHDVTSAFLVADNLVRAQQAQLDMARKALEDAVVRSPMDGYVAARSVNPGDKVSVDGELMTIVDLSRLEVEATVPSGEASRVSLGEEAVFRVHGIEGREFAGRVKRINPVVKPGSRSIQVYVHADNTDETLKGGMFVTGEIIAREARALAVPPGAIRRDDGGSYVLKIVNGQVTRQPISLSGDATTDRVGVLAGLSEGDIVVSMPSLDLAPGVRIRLGER